MWPWGKAIKGTGDSWDPFVLETPEGEACAWSWFPKGEYEVLGERQRGCEEGAVGRMA